MDNFEMEEDEIIDLIEEYCQHLDETDPAKMHLTSMELSRSELLLKVQPRIFIVGFIKWIAEQ